MGDGTNPLIVGAGPVGLATALFLQRASIATRIIDIADKPSPYSKALAVNPRTLELLEPTGVTTKMLAIGLRIHGVRFTFPDGRKGEMSLSALHHKFPFMLALSQAATERLLNEALEHAGRKVERGVGLASCRNTDGSVEANLKNLDFKPIGNYRCPWLLAADGAHSTARKSLNIEFEGSGFKEPWYLSDVPLSTSLEPNFAHIYFLDDGGFLFLIRVVDETSEQAPGPKLWRLISNLKQGVEKVPDATPAGKPVWESDFRIAHRLSHCFQSGNVYFAGDAAHIHSPMGARGMNLGIEDAWVFSQLAESHRLNEYEALRKACDKHVVNRIKLLSEIVMGRTMISRVTRTVFLRWLINLPFVRNKFLEAATGLDHSLHLKKPRKSDEHEGDALNHAEQHA